MRNTVILFVLLTSFGFLPAQNSVPRELKWEKIYNWKNKNIKAYVDVKSLRKHKDNNKEYNIGMVLFYWDEHELMAAPDRKIIANMYASHYITDCDTGRTAKLSDFYFNMNHLPTAVDQPLVAYDYSSNIQTVVELEKNDPVLGALCPVYI